MIPVKLALKNFMSYRDPPEPLVLDGIHIACICGDNGNGKSALLDAMTWALWGKARAKSTDDLVHSGQSDMEVELEFTIGEGRYRVIRKHTKGKPGRSGHTVLELQVTSKEDGSGFRAITANTVRETQARIIDLLRMDYDTFVNSAFLRQGRADEFTLRTPRERKQILADILNLSIYDELETGARKKAREIEVEVAVLENDLAVMEEELKKKPEVQGDLFRVKARLSEAERDEALQRVQVEKLARRKDLLEVNKAELERTRERTGQAQKDLHLLSEEKELHRRRIVEYEAVMEQQNAVTEGYGLFQEALGRKEELDRKLARSSALVEDRSRLEREIDAERVRLVGEVEGLRSRVQTLESKASNIQAWEEELAECSKRLADLDELEMELKQSADDLQETSVKIRHLESSNERLMREMQDLRDKVDMLEKGVAQCPLCGSALGEDGLDHIRSAYEEEGLGKKQEYLGNLKVIKEVSARHETARQEMDKKQGELARERRGTQGRISVLERDQEEGIRANEELIPLRTRLDDIDSRLAAGSFKIDTQKELEGVTSELEALGYDPLAHKQVSERLDQLMRYEELHRRLTEAGDRLPEVQQALELAESRESRLRSQMEVDIARQESIEAGLGALPQLERDLEGAKSSYEGLREEERRWRDRMIGLQEALRRMDEMEAGRAEKRAALKQATRDKGIYEELGRAFGKGGVQALIIETVLPEIEDEANRLLSRMTDNRMHVKIESQREKKTGGSLETLDINIADELGTRPYELFSGGEAFRINFALRIALSKLLAHRAGAPLPILFIDEGFGSQDGAGREKLLETINSIRSDFERILVITHIEELKEAFPVRIQVTKTEQGSNYFIN